MRIGFTTAGGAFLLVPHFFTAEAQSAQGFARMTCFFTTEDAAFHRDFARVFPSNPIHHKNHINHSPDILF